MSDRRSTIRAATAMALAMAAGACLDMSAPSGPASISVLQLPSPSVVVGDAMRDSAGNPAKLSILAFDANGDPLPGVTPQFFITDSNAVAHFDPSGFLVGDALGVVNVLGQIGNLQTPVAPVPITVAPTLIVSNQLPGDTLREPITQDTTQRGSLALKATATGANSAPAQGFIVHYTLLFAPATLPGKSPAVFLANTQSGKPVTADTTDATGVASVNLVIVTAFVSGAADSAVVQATATYKGQPIPGSPLLYHIPIKPSVTLLRR